MSEGSPSDDNTVNNFWISKRKRKKSVSMVDLSNNGKEGKGVSVIPDSSQSSPSVSKKLKQDPDLSQFANTERLKGEDGHYYECEICNIGGDLLCCESCPRTYHLECLVPPLESLPEGNWYCPICVKEEKETKAKPFVNTEVYSKRARTKRVLKKTVPAKLTFPTNNKEKMDSSSSQNNSSKPASSHRTIKVKLKKRLTDNNTESKSIDKGLEKKRLRSKKPTKVVSNIDSRIENEEYSSDSSSGKRQKDVRNSARISRQEKKKKSGSSSKKKQHMIDEFVSPSNERLEEQVLVGSEALLDNALQVDRVLGCRLREKDTQEDSLSKAEITESPLKKSSSKSDQFEFLIKWVGKSYIHKTWISESQLKALAKRKLENYRAKHGCALINLCNEKWTQPQKILSLKIEEDFEQVLVKWSGLNYDECTWESVNEPTIKEYSHLIDQFKKFESDALEKDSKNKVLKEKGENQELGPLTEQPDELKGGSLFPHQLEALNWLRKCWYRSKNVILADEMGLGKTISAAAFLSSLYCEFRVRLPSIVLVPLSTMPNWLAEFSLWAPHLNVVEYHGGAKARAIIRQFEWHANRLGEPGPSRTKSTINSYKFNVLLTTYEMVLADASYLRNVPWEVLIVDEGHRLKNSSSKLFGLLNTFKFNHRVLLTGTPLQNNIGEMYNLLNFLQPVSFPSLTAFEEKFNDLTTAEKVDELKKLVAPHMLRRLKRDAMQNIPPKTERVVPVELSSIQAKYYKAMLTKNYELLRNIGSSGGAQQQSLLNIVMQLRKVCNHPYLMPGTEPNIGTPEFLHEMRIKASAKLTLLHMMLRVLRRDGHRVLIFSQMTKLLDILEDYLLGEFGYGTYERVDGSVVVSERQAAIARFNEDKSRFVFLLSTRSCGLGINLATADTVIIYDSDFNPHADIQAMNRAHRIGQSNRLLVYRLVVRASVEERILQLAKKKLMLDQLFVNKSGEQKEVEDILKWGTEELFRENDGSPDVNADNNNDNNNNNNDNDNNNDNNINNNGSNNGEQRHRRRVGGLGDVYEDKCAGSGSKKLIWDENSVEKLLDRSDLQSNKLLESTDAEMESDMLGTVKATDWNDETTEDQAGADAVVTDGGDITVVNQTKDENAISGKEENEWDKLLRDRWEKYQVEEAASLGRGKRQRKAISYRETFAAIPSEALSESSGEEAADLPREYTPAGRARKEKFAKVRARQKEKIARRGTEPPPLPLLPLPLLLSLEEAKTPPKPTNPLILEPKNTPDIPSSSSKPPQDSILKSFTAPILPSRVSNPGSSSNHNLKSFTESILEKLESKHVNLNNRAKHNRPVSDLPLVPDRGPFVPNSVALASQLMPVLGLRAPNAPRKTTFSLKEPGEKRQAVSKPDLGLGLDNLRRSNKGGFRPDRERKQQGIGTDHVSATNHGDLLARFRNFDTRNHFPFGSDPFSPPTSNRLPFDPNAGPSSSFHSFQENMGLPNLSLHGFNKNSNNNDNDYHNNNINNNNNNAINAPHMHSNPSLDPFQPIPPYQQPNNNPTMPMHNSPFIPNFPFNQSPQMSNLGPILPPHQHQHHMPESHKKVLENIMMRSQCARNKMMKKKTKNDSWSEEELDFLWIGVRRHGRGNWENMLRDPKLIFSHYRTPEGLSAKWAEEQLKIFEEPVFKPVSRPQVINDEMLANALRGSMNGMPHHHTPPPYPKYRSHLTDIQLGFGMGDIYHGLLPQNMNPTAPMNNPYNEGSSKYDPSFFPMYMRNNPFLPESSNTPNSTRNMMPNMPYMQNMPNMQNMLNIPNDSPNLFHHGPNIINDPNNGAGSSKSTNLPHWLQKAVNVPVNTPPPVPMQSDNIPINTPPPVPMQGDNVPVNTLPPVPMQSDNIHVNTPPAVPMQRDNVPVNEDPAMTAGAQSLKLLYGEEKNKGIIPPFRIPGPPPSMPKDPRLSMKKKKKKEDEAKKSGLNLNLNSPSEKGELRKELMEEISEKNMEKIGEKNGESSVQVEIGGAILEEDLGTGVSPNSDE